MQIGTNNFGRFTFFVFFLLGISAFIGYLLLFFLGEKMVQLPVYAQLFLSIPTVPAIYSGLFSLFDKYFWKWKIFRYLQIIVVDDLNGRWEGFIKSSWNNFGTEIPTELTIKQTSTTIKIHGKFNESRSVSIHEEFGKSDIHDKTTLYYFYKNDPHYDAPVTMATHEGSGVLVFNQEDGTLSGYYYSGRDRSNYGTIEVHKVK